MGRSAADTANYLMLGKDANAFEEVSALSCRGVCRSVYRGLCISIYHIYYRHSYDHGSSTIDGQISPGEWDSCSASLICLSSSGGFSNPYGCFHIGRKATTFTLRSSRTPWTECPSAPPWAAAVRSGKMTHLNSPENGRPYLSAHSQLQRRHIRPQGWGYRLARPWKVATSLIGTDYAVGYAGGEKPKRGFVAEVMLPMDQAGLPLPVDGQVWGMQVVLDQVKVNPQAVWQPMGEVLIANSQFGKAVWGGPPNRLQNAIIKDDGPCGGI